jgi:hypothetical protein
MSTASGFTVRKPEAGSRITIDGFAWCRDGSPGERPAGSVPTASPGDHQEAGGSRPREELAAPDESTAAEKQKSRQNEF